MSGLTKTSKSAPGCAPRRPNCKAGRLTPANSSSSSRATSTCRRRSRQKLEPRQLGNLYEIRIYTFKPGGIPATIDRWSTQIAERTKLSPLAGAWYSELGGLNKWCHIWAYKDAGERFRIREEARAKGIWPPKGGQPGMMLKQENMLVVPASFSPLH